MGGDGKEGCRDARWAMEEKPPPLMLLKDETLDFMYGKENT